MSSPENEPFMLPEDEESEVKVTLEDKDFYLTWDNTIIRRFHFGEGEFDHIYHIYEPDKAVLIFIGSTAGQGVIERLEGGRFPTRTDPELDETTIDVYSRMQSDILEKDLENGF